MNLTIPSIAMFASTYHHPSDARGWSVFNRKNRNKPQRVLILDLEGIDIKPEVAETMSITPEIHKNCVIHVHFATSNQPLVEAVRVDANL